MFKKIFGYFKYRKLIKDNYPVLSQRFKFKYDKIYGRLYTVISIPEDRQEILKKYGYQYLDNEVKKFITTLEEYFSSNNLLDIISISRVDSIDEVNVLIVLRYRYKNHQIILYVFLGLIGLIASVCVVAGLVKLLIFLVNFIISL